MDSLYPFIIIMTDKELYLDNKSLTNAYDEITNLGYTQQMFIIDLQTATNLNKNTNYYLDLKFHEEIFH